jgi:outer membrane protein assembly factor BamB
MAYRKSKPAADLVVVGMNGKLRALHRATGEEAWQNPLKGGGLGEVALLVANGHVFASTSQGTTLHCLDHETGEERWRRACTTYGSTTLVWVEDRIIAAKGGYIESFDIQGKKLWGNSLSGMGTGTATVAVRGTVAYGTAPGP